MVSRDRKKELQQAKAAQQRLRDQLDKLTDITRVLEGKSPKQNLTIEETRRLQAQQKKQQRAAAALIIIPPCANKSRRTRLEKDDVKWLRYYFGPGCGLDDPFTYEFTEQQREMIAAIRHAIQYGDDQALAASRGEGKTTLTERLVMKTVLSGEVDYVVVFAQSGAMADNTIDAIKQALSENTRLQADYPEVCVPVIELEGVPQRAKTQRANGARHDNRKPFEMADLNYSWCGQELIFPNTPGSPSAGSIIATRGLDAAVRGLKKRGKRPKLAIIDDPDTEDTSRSEEQANKLERRIDAAIGGLGGQRRSIGRVILTTLQSRIAASYKYTDPTKKPTFKGRRYRFLVKPPDNVGLWDEYVAIRTENLQARDSEGNDTDPFARKAHQFYLDHRAEMDAGAVVSNPNRFNDSKLPDGSQIEVSALQHYYNLVAKLGQEVVSTEYDNDPPEQSAIIDSGLSPNRIQRQVNGFDRGVIPPGCTLLTHAMDVRKVALHWVVKAWKPDGTFHIIDYGVHEIHGTIYGHDEGVDAAITRGVLSRMESLKETVYATPDGEVLPVDLTLVDAGWKTDAVYSACLQVGAGIMPIMGVGKSAGCVKTSFSDVLRATPDKQPGNHWFRTRRPRLWLVMADADYWKGWEHDRWLTSPELPGAGFMCGLPNTQFPDRMSDDQKSHHSFARHICNESEVEEPQRDGTIRRRWKSKSENNHWFDASYYANVAASIRGIKLATSAAAQSGGISDRRVVTIPEHMRKGGR